MNLTRESSRTQITFHSIETKYPDTESVDTNETRRTWALLPTSWQEKKTRETDSISKQGEQTSIISNTLNSNDKIREQWFAIVSKRQAIVVIMSTFERENRKQQT